jgi:RHS repeat-associated protein
MDGHDVRLGYRGQIEFDGEIWLRNRTYDPASRSFQQPDPLAPVPGTASAANPYHYAANNPLGLSDPLGLRAVTDHELQAVRDRMDRGWADDVGDYVGEHAGDISAISVVLAPIGAFKTFKAGLAGDAMRDASKGAGESLDLARGAESVNLPGLAASRYRDADKLLKTARESSALRQTLRDQKQMLDYVSAPLALVGMGRSHGIKHGLYKDPYMPNPVPSFVLR